MCVWARGERPRRRLRPALGRLSAASGLAGPYLSGFYFLLFFFLPLALVSLADVAAGGGRGSSVIAWDLGASLSSPFSSPAAAGVAKDFS